MSTQDVRTDLTYDALKALADSLPAFRGWDFSPMRTARDPVPWDYHDVVRRYLTPASHVLDVGTGGGEQFLRLAPAFGRGIGADPNHERIRAARENVAQAEAGGLPHGRVAFQTIPSDFLPFPDGSFDAVLLRHAPVFMDEIVRVLRPGGYFVTQGVGRRNMRSICTVFGVTAYGEPLAGAPLRPSRSQDRTGVGHTFRRRGRRATVVARAEYDVRYFVRDAGSLIFWVRALDLPVGGFDINRHWSQLAQIIRDHTGPQGIQTNEHRSLLVVRRE